MLTDQNLWYLYASGLAQACGLPSLPDDFVLAGTSLPAPFAVGSTGLGAASPTQQEALGALYQLGDGEAHLEGVYAPTGGSFFSVYANYIDNLVPNGGTGMTPAQQAALALARKAVDAANAQYNTDLDAAAAAYDKANTLFPGKYADFQDYLNGTAWGGTLSTDLAALTGANSKVRAQLSGIYGAGYVAIQTNQAVVDQVRQEKTAKTSGTRADMLVTFDSGDQVVPTYNNGTSFAAIATWVDGVLASANAKGVLPQNKTVSFGSSSAASNFSASSFSASTNWSVNRFFWSATANAAGGRSQSSVVTKTSSFSLTVGFADLKQMVVTPGAWFDSSLLTGMPNPDQVLVPTVLWLAMGPVVTMSMDAASYAQAKSSYTSKAGFGVSLWCGVSGNGSFSADGQRCDTSFDDTNHTITLRPSDTSPVVVAMQMTPIDKR